MGRLIVAEARPLDERKTCSRCGEEKAIGSFHRNAAKPDGLDHYCKSCRSRYEKAHRPQRRETGRRKAKAWRTKNPEKARAVTRTYKQKLRKKLIAKLGGKCSTCGTTHRLELHHEGRDGRMHRLRAGGAVGTYLEILKDEYKGRVTLKCKPCHRREEINW